MKKIIIALAVATVVAFVLSLVKPDLLSLRDIEGFLASPQESAHSLAEAGSSAAKETAQKLAEKGSSAAKEAASSLVDKGAQAAQEAATGALNQAVDSWGLKSAAEAELRAREADIAAATGLDAGTVDYVITSMDIPNWQTTTLPDSVYAQTSIPFTYAGTSATLTTYDDPGYMTLDAYGQSITFAVPAGAQEYIPYLAYAAY